MLSEHEIKTAKQAGRGLALAYIANSYSMTALEYLKDALTESDSFSVKHKVEAAIFWLELLQKMASKNDKENNE